MFDYESFDEIHAHRRLYLSESVLTNIVVIKHFAKKVIEQNESGRPKDS